MAKRNQQMESGGMKVPRKSSAPWTQDETETLCDLLLKHGTGAVLNKMTNAGTKEQRENEWRTIETNFQAVTGVNIANCTDVLLLSLMFLCFFRTNEIRRR